MASRPGRTPPAFAAIPPLPWRLGWMAGGAVAALLLVAFGYRLGQRRSGGTDAAADLASAAPQASAAAQAPHPGVATTDVTDRLAPPHAAPGAAAAPAVLQAPTLAPHAAPALPAASTLSTPRTAAALTEALAALSRTAPCAVPRLEVSAAGAVAVSGLVGAGAPSAALRQAVQATAPAAPLAWNVADVDGPVCAALDLIRPIAQPNSSGVTLDLGLQGGVLQLHEHDPIAPILRLPAYPAYLQVDYLSHDGTVRHLYPTADTPDQPLPQAASISLTEQARTTWHAGPPFGTDVIIAVAASVPLFTPRRLAADDTVRSYLPALQAAIEAAQRQHAQVTGQALALHTLPQ
jgi:hypothetical protein